MDPVGTARKPLAIKFYLLAIVFLLFDVELLFIYPWAVALNAEGGLSQEARLPILVVMMTLLATLAIAYFYAWRKGVFQWRHR
jgi:NADH:ubiquinone oxidoreductase subunit 3 (subunit A)